MLLDTIFINFNQLAGLSREVLFVVEPVPDALRPML